MGELTMWFDGIRTAEFTELMLKVDCWEVFWLKSWFHQVAWNETDDFGTERAPFYTKYGYIGVLHKCF